MRKSSGFFEIDCNYALVLYRKGDFSGYAQFTNQLSTEIQANIAMQILNLKNQGLVPKFHGISSTEIPVTTPE